MSTQTGPQQLQLARRIPEMQELDLRDPPGRIAATRERSHTAYPPHPYPLDKPPLTMLISHLEEDWLHACQEVLIFTHQVPEPDDEKIHLLDKKSEHFQFYFWTALDRARRLNQPLNSRSLWKIFDFKGMLNWWRICHQATTPACFGESNDGLWRDLLLSSPWFDRPLFHDLLWEAVTDDDGQPRTETVDGEDILTLKRRDPRSGALE